MFATQAAIIIIIFTFHPCLLLLITIHVYYEQCLFFSSDKCIHLTTHLSTLNIIFNFTNLAFFKNIMGGVCASGKVCLSDNKCPSL